MNFIFPCLLLISLIFASDQIPAPEQDKPILLKGGTIHTVSNGTLSNTDLLFNEGKIIRIEPDIIVDPAMKVIHIEGKHVFPGLIAANAVLGLVEINAVRATRDLSETGNINPNVNANVSYNPDSELIPVTRSNGVLMANVAPTGGLISGNSSLMMLDGWTWEESTFLHPTALHIHWPNMSINYHEKSKKKPPEQKSLRQAALQELEDIVNEVKAYEKIITNQEMKTPDSQGHDLRLESMIPYFIQKKLIFIHANEQLAIESAIHWANRNELNICIVGGRDSWQLTELLVEYQVPVVYDHVLTVPSLRYADYDQNYKTPSILHQAGIPFCISASSSSFQAPHLRNLPYYAAMASAYGLPQEEALRAITLSVAEILGVEDQIGSLEIGKDATLFISNGHILEITTQVETAYIQGRLVDLNNRHKTLYNKYQQKYRQKGILP